ncbi:DUF4127 family protein [Thermoanaerobacterium sp. RBIITD]|uniref:DUF4127 family protein n=1 Tax=Thermoanaerobacterium sp. RBIITD TaxID=1550240 RepID=UPI000BB6E3AE|nr:DUF4127 family protein [Thermoanaerobacterium sp. RBIITD]SNX53592.1 Protein of unknown function [Thermoanaerobacterium sp. RBIITD]
MKKIITFIIIFIITINVYCNKVSYKDNLKYAYKEKIVFVPLDTRPVSLQNVEILSNAGGKELLVPPMDTLDYYMKKGNQNMLYEWLKVMVKRPDVSAVVISTNQFLSGGLIASRNYLNNIKYKEGVARLKNIIEMSGNKRIILISIMPQAAPTLYEQDTKYVQNQTNIEYYKMMKNAISNSDEIELNKLKSRMPSNLFNYMYVIASEGLINNEIASSLKSNVILTIGLDDTTMKSMLNYAYNDLKNGIKKYKNIYMLHGADEISMLAIARLINEENNFSPAYKIAFEKKEDENMYLPYEGGTIKEITVEKIDYIGGKASDDAKNIVYIHSHIDNKIGIKSAIDKYKNNGQNFGIADVAYTNGGDQNLVQDIIRNNLLKNIDAYSGWNTPSNSIGTVIAELSIKSNIDRIKDKKISIERYKDYYAFTFIRYADDYVYQRIVRNEMQNWAKSNGENPDNLKNINEADTVLKEKMRQYLDKLVKGYDDNDILKINSIEVQYPWRRMFEVEVEPKY